LVLDDAGVAVWLLFVACLLACLLGGWLQLAVGYFAQSFSLKGNDGTMREEYQETRRIVPKSCISPAHSLWSI
jgi:membrane protein YqaA with SNARE-associated domain